MYDWNTDDAVYQIQLSRTQKGTLVQWWDAAEQYFNNTILGTRTYDPSKLITHRVKGRWGIDNLIPDAVRAFAAWVVNSSFEVTVDPLGDSKDEIRFIAARTLLQQVNFYRQQPQFTQMIREIAIRTKLFNIVAQIDGWDDKRDEPYSRLVTHNDLFMDPTAWASVNEPNGPRWVAVKYMLSADEVIARYGSLKGLTTGLLSQSSEDKPTAGEGADAAFRSLYEIYEWFGIDETEVAVEREEQRQLILNELAAVRQGTYVGPNDDIEHQYALEYGDGILIDVVRDQLPGEDVDTIEQALNLLTQIGNGALADAYMQWRQSHQEFIDTGYPGGTRPKYPGYIYHVDFQIGQDEPLLGPESCDYPHYQIPVSIYRSHLNTGGLFGLGSMPEVLSLQSELEWWNRCEKDHAHYTANPPFVIDMDTLDPRYTVQGGMKRLISDIREGFNIIRMRGMARGAEPHFVNMGTFSVDVRRIIEYIRYRIQEVIGPTPELRGHVSGEVSGRAFEMRRESAARPLIDTLSLIEGPLQKHFERMVMNILDFSPIEKIEQISGQEGAAAIEYVRESLPDFRCAVKVDLGTGMPTDWNSKANWAMGLLQMGRTDGKLVEEWLGSPIPITEPMMPPAGAPAGAGQALPA